MEKWRNRALDWPDSGLETVSCCNHLLVEDADDEDAVWFDGIEHNVLAMLVATKLRSE